MIHMNLSKKMIACVAVILALFAFSPATYAQQRGDTAAMRQRQEAMIQKLTTDLKLTPVQVDSLKAISGDMQGKRREIFMDQSMSREDKMAKMAPLNEAANKRIQAVLGADLYKKYQDWMEQNRPQRGGGGGGGRGN
jgi:predicted transglutaminase-like cysteine proteinase